MNNTGKFLFKYRSYTPIPFIVVMLVFLNPNLISISAGLILAIAGELLRIWAVGFAGDETRTTARVGASQLIVSGPFAYIRNPLYVGNIFIYTGSGVASNALFPYLQIAGLVFFSVQYYLIVKGEERYLLEEFGDTYREYMENVPAFIPAVSPYKGSDTSQPHFDIWSALCSERRTLQAFGLIIILIVGLWYIKFIFDIPF